jgi:hypothetical protein
MLPDYSRRPVRTCSTFLPCACGCGQSVLTKFASAYKLGHRPLKPATYRWQGYARLHRQRAEAALGHPLPPGACVHHADGTKRDDSQLVICQDNAYHRLLHQRMRILRAGGNPNTDWWCSACKQPRSQVDFYVRRQDSEGKRAGRPVTVCRTCLKQRDQRRLAAGYWREWWQRRRA